MKHWLPIATLQPEWSWPPFNATPPLMSSVLPPFNATPPPLASLPAPIAKPPFWPFAPLASLPAPIAKPPLPPLPLLVPFWPLATPPFIATPPFPPFTVGLVTEAEPERFEHNEIKLLSHSQCLNKDASFSCRIKKWLRHVLQRYDCGQHAYKIVLNIESANDLRLFPEHYPRDSSGATWVSICPHVEGIITNYLYISHVLKKRLACRCPLSWILYDHSLAG